MKTYVVKVPNGPAELVEADSHTVTERTLTFTIKDGSSAGKQVRQFNNRGGWNSWELLES